MLGLKFLGGLVGATVVLTIAIAFAMILALMSDAHRCNYIWELSGLEYKYEWIPGRCLVKRPTGEWVPGYIIQYERDLSRLEKTK